MGTRVCLAFFAALILFDIVVEAKQTAGVQNGKHSETKHRRYSSPVKNEVAKAKRQLSPASRLQQMLNEYRAIYDQFKKTKKFNWIKAINLVQVSNLTKIGKNFVCIFILYIRVK